VPAVASVPAVAGPIQSIENIGNVANGA